MAYSAGIFVLRSRLKEVKSEENSTCFGCILSFPLHSTPLWLCYIIVGTDYMSLLFSLSCIDISCKLYMFILTLDHLLSLCIVCVMSILSSWGLSVRTESFRFRT